MKEELTRVFEKYELEAMIEYYKNNDCSRRVVIELATALLAEKAKSKGDVWENAPDNAGHAWIAYYETGFEETPIKSLGFVRQLPKTRARKYAENLYRKLSFERISDNQSIDAIEELLNKYAEELTKKETN